MLSRLTEWKTYFTVIESWKSNNTRETAWMNLMKLLKNDRFGMAELAENMTKLAKKLQKSKTKPCIQLCCIMYKKYNYPKQRKAS